MKLSDSARMKQADARAISERHIDSLALMETAAGHLADAASRFLNGNDRAVIFCGPGNNGGDGVAAARILSEKYGASVRIFLTGSREKMSPDSKEMEKRLIASGGVLEDFSEDDPDIRAAAMNAGVIIDAIFGIGLNRAPAGSPLAAIKLMNASPAPVVSADIASGVSADNGSVPGDAVRAAVTVTFSRAKPGHFAEPGILYRGELRITDIGIPEDILAASDCSVSLIRSCDVQLPPRALLSHKGDHGKLLILSGSTGYTGAPSLCARAAVRSGAGLVWLGVPKDIYMIEAVKNDEAMPFPLPFDLSSPPDDPASLLLDRLNDRDVIAAGPGLGRSAGTTALVRSLFSHISVPLVLDADALWVLSQDLSALDTAPSPVILTPHEGEFRQLLGQPIRSRLSDAAAFASAHHCIVVLKGHRTVCAFPDGEISIIDAGGPGMAKGGTGDVLTGVIAAMLGQFPLKKAVITACWLHARAGDIAASRFGEYAMTASDIIEQLPAAQREIIVARNI